MKPEIKERIQMIRNGEVPEGYKRENFRVIPFNWYINIFEQVVEKIEGGGTPSRENSSYYEGDIPWATVKDMREENYKSTTIEKISQTGIEHSSANIIDKGSFIISTRMGLGRGFINTVPMAINQDLKGIYPKKRKVDTVYLMYWYKSNKGFIQSLGDGSTVKGITLNTLKKLKIQTPPIKEQQQIANILSTWDKAIELKEQLLQQKKLQKKGLMQLLLTGKQRLPGFNGEWEQVLLNKICSSVKYSIVDGPFGSQLKKEEYKEYGIPLVEMENLKNGAYIKLDNVKWFVSDEKFNQISRSAIYPGDIIISKTGTLGLISIVPENISKAVITSRLAKISIDKNKANIKYIYYYLNYLNLNNYFERVASGSTMLILGLTELQKLKVKIPSLNEQQAIANILSTADKEIGLLQKEIDELKEQKKGLMQLLLTGIVRVNNLS